MASCLIYIVEEGWKSGGGAFGGILVLDSMKKTVRKVDRPVN